MGRRPRTLSTMAGTPAATRLQTHLESEEELATAWEAWNASTTVLCKREGAPIALTVDATVATYRFVCTECGTVECLPEIELRTRGKPPRAVKQRRVRLQVVFQIALDQYLARTHGPHALRIGFGLRQGHAQAPRRRAQQDAETLTSAQASGR